jgi:hypothetical protein
MSDDRSTASAHTDHARCGCCGQARARSRLAELGDTPGTFICTRCALWAAGRIARSSRLGRLGRRLPHRRPRPGVLTAVPVLAATDLDRTAELYGAAGFEVTGRHDGYLVMHAGPVELHFAQDPETTPGACYFHVADVATMRERLDTMVAGSAGPLGDTDYGLREFWFTDPDGNRVRFGSPVS